MKRSGVLGDIPVDDISESESDEDERREGATIAEVCARTTGVVAVASG
jgi:hypothetical protein